mgnify:CR=1 FL=1
MVYLIHRTTHRTPNKKLSSELKMNQKFHTPITLEKMKRVLTLPAEATLTDIGLSPSDSLLGICTTSNRLSQKSFDQESMILSPLKKPELPFIRRNMPSDLNPTTFIPRTRREFQRLTNRYPSVSKSNKSISSLAQEPSISKSSHDEYSRITYKGNFSLSKEPCEFGFEKIQELRIRSQPALTKREELRKMDFSSRAYMSTMKLLITHFETIYNKFADNILSLSSEQFAIANSCVEAELMTYLLIKNLWAETERITLLEQEKRTLGKENETLKRTIRDLYHQEKEFAGLTRRLKEANERASSIDSSWKYQKASLQIEKNKLGEECDLLTSKLQESAGQIAKLTQSRDECEVRVRAVEKERDGLAIKVDRLEAIVRTMSLKTEDFAKDYQACKLELVDLKKKLSSLKGENSRHKDLYLAYRERANMSREECSVYQSRCFDLQGVNKKLREKLRDLPPEIPVVNAKAKHETKASHHINEKSSELMALGQTVKADLEIISFVSEKLFRKSKKVDVEVFNVPRLQLDTFDRMELKDFTIKRMPFESIFEGLEAKALKENKDPVFDLDFVVTIRAILDSKYNEFICYGDDYHDCSRFSEFVFSWLGKFIFDSKSRRLRLIGIDDPEPAVLRGRFLSLLQNPLSYKLWDVITFKEFLTEEMAVDEVLFYLHCRFLLFQGPMLNSLSRTFTYKCFVPIKRLFEVVDIVLGPSASKEKLVSLKKKLEERIVNKKVSQELVDSGFGLRVLLEGYRRNKLRRFRKIFKLINSQKNISSEEDTFSISYHSFANCLHTIHPTVSELETTEMYRRSWSVGQGKVDGLSVLIALNDSGFFLRGLKLLTKQDTPKLGQNLSLEAGSKWEYLANKYDEVHLIIQELNNIGRDLGVEPLINQLYEGERFFQNKFQIDSSVMNGKLLVTFIGWFHQTITKIVHWKYHVGIINNGGREMGILERLMQTWTKTLKDFGDCTLEDKQKRAEEDDALRRLQRFFRYQLAPWRKVIDDLNGKTPISKRGRHNQSKSLERSPKVDVNWTRSPNKMNPKLLFGSASPSTKMVNLK